MAIRRVTPAEAAGLQGEGWTYVDVRPVAEFELGHPAGAVNAPFLLQGAGGMVANPDFEPVMSAAFARDAQLMVGCRTGVCSPHAAKALAALGYDALIDVRGGFAGEVDALGQIVCPGWSALGLPTSTTAEPGKSWLELARLAPKGK